MHFIKERLKTVIGFLFRLLPLCTETGLRIFGNPDENSPVLITGNFDLTVKRVGKHLKDMDCYLLVAPSRGVNVWCAADGGFFNEHSVISAIRTSGIDEKVTHRTLILPQLSASGIDIKAVRKETGWRCKFGPVYAKDIPEYVKNDFKKTEEMRRAKYDLVDRLDAGIGGSFMFYLIAVVFIFIFRRSWFYEIPLLGAALILLLYTFVPWIPGKSGWRKIFSAEIFVAVALGVCLLVFEGDFAYTNLFLGSLIIIPVIGTDFGGLSSIYMSDLDPVLIRLGFHKLGPLQLKGTQRAKLITGVEKLSLDAEKCIGCRMCYEVCSKGVYTIDKEARKATANYEKCVLCLSCAPQCPTGALFFEEVKR